MARSVILVPHTNQMLAMFFIDCFAFACNWLWATSRPYLEAGRVLRRKGTFRKA